jgi:hypothetical protein
MAAGGSGHRMTPGLACRRALLTAALGFAVLDTRLDTRGKSAPR